jgi:hypothetical protein
MQVEAFADDFKHELGVDLDACSFWRVKTTFRRVIAIGCACRLVEAYLGMPPSVPNCLRRVPTAR